MLQPSMDGLGGVLLVLIVVAIIWIRHLIKFQEKGLILFIALCFFTWSSIQIVDLWFDMNDGKMVIVIVAMTVVTLLLFLVNKQSLSLHICLAVLAMSVILFVAYSFWWKNDIKTYIAMRLKNEYPNIEFFYWANNPQVPTDWKGIFEEYRDNDYVIKEAVFLYLRNVESSAAIANNISFRDEAFTAWSTFNKTHPRPIDFSNPGGYDSDNYYLSEIADARPFMKWWTSMALKDAQQAIHIGYFLNLVNASVESNMSNENNWNDFIATFQECKEMAAANANLSEGFQKSIDTIIKKQQTNKEDAQ